MVRKYIAGFALVLVAAIGFSTGVVRAQPPKNISQTVGVCDPVYPLRCVKPDASGNTPVTLAAGSASIGTVAISQTTPGTTNGVQTLTGSTTAVTQATAANLNAAVVGNVAAGVADSGPPVKVGAKYNATLPTVTDGQRGDLQITAKGSLRAIAGGTRVTGADDLANNVILTSDEALVGATGTLGTLPYLFDGTNLDLPRSVPGASGGAGVGVQAVGVVPTSSAVSAITPVVSTALESCRVLKSGAGNLYSLAVTIQATTGIVQVFNAISAPGDGAVTPIWSMPVISNGTLGGASWQWSIPLRFGTGATVCFSSATTPFTKTASATAMFTGAVQ